MTGLRRIADALGSRRGEGRLVGPLLLHSFLSGLSVVFFESVANGLFLSRFPAESLPLAYVGAAICVPLTGIAYERLQSKLSPLRVFQVALAFLAAMPLAMALLVSRVDAAWPAFLLMSLSYVMWALPALEFWGLAARVLDLRQAKRLYGLVGTGEVAGIIVGGAIVGALLARLSVPGVLALTSLAAFACMPLPGLLLARVANQPSQEDEAESDDGVRGGFLDTLRAIGRDKYLLILVAFDASYQLTHDALEYTSQVQIQARFAGDNEAVTTFVGYLFALQQVLVLVLRALLSGRLVSRFGLGVGLMVTPAVVVAGGLAVLALGMLTPGGDASPLFWPIIALRMAEVGLLYGIGKPAVLVALRPLAPARRDRGQVLLETAVEPGSTGLTGVNLLALNWMLGAAATTAARVMAFVSLLVATAIAWVTLGGLVRRAYARAVREGLEHGALQDVDLSNDPATIRALEERLLQGKPEEAAAALALVEPRLDDARVAEVFARLLPSGEPTLRDAIYRRLASRPVAAMRTMLAERVEQEETPELRAAALRALATTGTDVARKYLDSSEILLVEVAIGVALRDGDGRAKSLVEQWAGAPESDRRARAARVLTAAGVSGFSPTVHRLLADAAPEVRDAALLAAAVCPGTNRWDEIAAALGQTGRWRIAAEALGKGGDGATKALVAVLERESAGRTARTRAVRLLGKQPTPAAIAALWRAATDPSSWLRLEAVHVLRKTATVVPMPAATVRSQLDHEERRAVALACALTDLADLPEDSPLRRLLLHELARGREVVFGLLALAYDARTVRRARHQIRSGLPEMRDLAFEVLDTMLSEKNRATLLPILDTLTPRELLAKLPPALQGDRLSHASRLEALAHDDRPWVRLWARHAQGKEEEKDAMHLLEKIVALQGVEFFASADEDLLAEIAASVVVQTLGPDVTIIEGGSVEASMFVVAKGRVRVVPAGGSPVELGAGAVFGELAALDPQPRSATVSTVTDTVLLRVSHSTVVDLMAEHIEIAHGIIRFLIRRYGRPGQIAPQ